MCVKVRVGCEYMLTCVWLLTEARSCLWMPGAEVKDDCGPPSIGTRNQTQFLCKNSQRFQTLSQFFSPFYPCLKIYEFCFITCFLFVVFS